MSLGKRLQKLTMKGELFEPLEESRVRCTACAHRCRIAEGGRGICQVRFNEHGSLRVPGGYVSSLQVDPIEKKPFYHFLAGSDALTFGMLGCNFHCSFCQNWLTSQALHVEAGERLVDSLRPMTSDQIISCGVNFGAEVVASSYNEPLITSEWAREIFEKGLQEGLQPVYVSNGYATPQVLDYLQPVLRGFKVDLKTMQEGHYRGLGGQLQPVLDSISYAHQLGLWVEVVTLVIPEFNDSDQELTEMARFIQGVSPDIPWHVTAFRPAYQMTDRSSTSSRRLLRAAEIGCREGLHYVYAGNLPGSMGTYEHTHCHSCGTRLIERTGFMICSYRITGEGTCPECGIPIPGVWSDHPGSTRRTGRGYPRVI